MKKKMDSPEPEIVAGSTGPAETQTSPAEDAASAPASGAGETLGPKEIDDLRSQAAKAGENWDKYLRATADLDNFRKRVARERQDAAKYAYEPILKKLIPVLDNFEVALAAAGTLTDPSLQPHLAGLNMIHQQFKTALTEAGLEEINAEKQPFDPNWHEAVSQQESSEVPDGHVMQQLRKGYKLRDRLLRPATVVVARPPAAPSSDNPA